MRLGFSKLVGKLVVKYMDLHILRVYFKKKKKKEHLRWTYQMMLMRCCVVVFFLIFFIKAYDVGTHMNCINNLMQFKWVPTTYTFIKM